MILAIIFGPSSADKYLLAKIADKVVYDPEPEIASTPRTLGQGPSDRKISIEQKEEEHNSGEHFSAKMATCQVNFETEKTFGIVIAIVS